MLTPAPPAPRQEDPVNPATPAQTPEDAHHGPNGPNPAPGDGCCPTCGGSGHTGDPDTWGWCTDCRGTGHDHPIDTIVDRIACVIATSASNHGTHDHHGQAAEVLDWLSKRDPSPWLQIVNDRIVVHWPDNAAPATLVARELVEGWAAQVNQLRNENERLRALLTEVLGSLEHSNDTEVYYPGDFWHTDQDPDGWRKRAGL